MVLEVGMLWDLFFSQKGSYDLILAQRALGSSGRRPPWPYLKQKTLQDDGFTVNQQSLGQKMLSGAARLTMQVSIKILALKFSHSRFLVQVTQNGKMCPWHPGSCNPLRFTKSIKKGPGLDFWFLATNIISHGLPHPTWQDHLHTSKKRISLRSLVFSLKRVAEKVLKTWRQNFATRVRVSSKSQEFCVKRVFFWRI